jgi:hypothetical protein
MLWTADFSVYFFHLLRLAVSSALHSVSKWHFLCIIPLSIEVVFWFLSVFVLIDELKVIGDDREVIVLLLFFGRSRKGQFFKNERKNRGKLLLISGLVMVPLNVDELLIATILFVKFL